MNALLESRIKMANGRLASSIDGKSLNRAVKLRERKLLAVSGGLSRDNFP